MSADDVLRAHPGSGAILDTAMMGDATLNQQEAELPNSYQVDRF